MNSENIYVALSPVTYNYLDSSTYPFFVLCYSKIQRQMNRHILYTHVHTQIHTKLLLTGAEKDQYSIIMIILVYCKFNDKTTLVITRRMAECCKRIAINNKHHPQSFIHHHH